MAGQHAVVEQRVAPRLVAGVRALVPKGQVGKQFMKYLDRVYAAGKNVTPIHTPGGLAATTTHWGDYGGIRAANDAIQDWSRTTGKRLAGPSWEVYGQFDPDPAKCRTDIYYSLAE